MTAMLNGPSILLTGAAPDRLNRNAIMRSYVADGFRKVIGDSNILDVGLQSASHVAERIRPDAVICFGSCMPDDSDYLLLRDTCSRIGSCLVFWLHDDPYEFDFGYRAVEVADVIFSNDKWAAAHYDHPKTFHLPMAASKRAHYRPIETPKDIDIFFCGVAFSNRVTLLRDLDGVLRNHNSLILGDEWPTDIHKAENRRLNNAELADHYSKSSITLNIGRHFNYANDRFQLAASTPGPRTFEAAMAGTVQMYFVESLEIEEYYTPDKEILLFDSYSDFEVQVSTILKNPELALNIAAAAQQRTLREHTYEARARKIMEIVFGSSVGNKNITPGTIA